MDSSVFHGILPRILDIGNVVEGAAGTLDTATLSILTSFSERSSQLQSLGLGRGLQVPSTIEGFSLYSMWARELRLRASTPSTATYEIPIVGLLQNSSKRSVKIISSSSRRDVGPEERPPPVLRDANGDLVKVDMRGWVVDRVSGELVQRQSYGDARTFVDEESSGDLGIATSILIPKVTIQTTYFATTRPREDQSGKKITPPVSIADLPEVVQITSERARLQSPFGWILDTREIDVLFTGLPPTGINYSAPPPSTSTDLRTGLFAVSDTITYYVALIAD